MAGNAGRGIRDRGYPLANKLSEFGESHADAWLLPCPLRADVNGREDKAMSEEGTWSEYTTPETHAVIAPMFQMEPGDIHSMMTIIVTDRGLVLGGTMDPKNYMTALKLAMLEIVMADGVTVPDEAQPVDVPLNDAEEDKREMEDDMLAWIDSLPETKD